MSVSHSFKQTRTHQGKYLCANAPWEESFCWASIINYLWSLSSCKKAYSYTYASLSRHHFFHTIDYVYLTHLFSFLVLLNHAFHFFPLPLHYITRTSSSSWIWAYHLHLISFDSSIEFTALWTLGNRNQIFEGKLVISHLFLIKLNSVHYSCISCLLLLYLSKYKIAATQMYK